MGLEATNAIDSIGTEKDTGVVVMTILDSWNWSDTDAHLRALQAKLNTYLNFVSSGQILEDYPQAADKPLRLDILARFDIPPDADELIRQARIVVTNLGFTLTHQKL